MLEQSFFTSESVSEGHPDKLADQVSDAILDAVLDKDPNARVAIETLVAHGFAIVAGELTSEEAYVDIASLVRKTIEDVGYISTELGFDARACGVLVAVHEQSKDIAMGVDRGGAGDQGIMFGYASDETEHLMPLPITLAHALTKASADVRKSHASLELRPDSKSQVSIIYEDGVPKAIDTVVMSQQHSERNKDTIQDIVMESIIAPVLQQFEHLDQSNIKYHINPTGMFIVGGPEGDTGLTGRKIIVDTYGGMAPHGGGAFSGKDPTKVDRSACYMARHIAKCVVAAGLARRCQVALAYAIGVEQPVSIHIDTYGTETISHADIVKRVRDTFDMSPKGIIAHLDLRRPIYLPTAKNGHFGKPEFPWESTEPASALQ